MLKDRADDDDEIGGERSAYFLPFTGARVRPLRLGWAAMVLVFSTFFLPLLSFMLDPFMRAPAPPVLSASNAGCAALRSFPDVQVEL